MQRRGLAVAALALAPVLATAACGAESPDAAATSPSVVATTTVLGDVVADIAACAGGTASTLMPIGTDPHDFSPSSAQVADVVGADLVVANGLGLEEGLTDALESAAADGAVVIEVAPLLDPREDAGSLDPHFWHDVSRMAEAARLVGDEMASVTGDARYAECGDEVATTLLETDTEVRAALSLVPDDRRVLVTDHDALGYLADAYDFEVAGVVVPGGATLAQPSSQQLSDLVAVIEAEDVPAIFSNTAAPTSLTEAVAAEVGGQVEVVELFVGSLGPDGSGAETYAGMVLTNAERIAEALG